MNRYAIFVHDPEGDSGAGAIVGPFRSAEAAEAKAETIRNVSLYADFECLVLLVLPGSTSAAKITDFVDDPAVC